MIDGLTQIEQTKARTTALAEAQCALCDAVAAASRSRIEELTGDALLGLAGEELHRMVEQIRRSPVSAGRIAPHLRAVSEALARWGECRLAFEDVDDTRRAS